VGKNNSGWTISTHSYLGPRANKPTTGENKEKIRKSRKEKKGEKNILTGVSDAAISSSRIERSGDWQEGGSSKVDNTTRNTKASFAVDKGTIALKLEGKIRAGGLRD